MQALDEAHADEEKDDAEDENEHFHYITATLMNGFAQTKVLKLDIRRVARFLKLQAEGAELEVLFLERRIDADAVLEGDPHELRGAELLQVARLVLQLSHLLLNCDHFVEFGVSEGISTLCEQLKQLCVVKAELDVKDFLLTFR